jgi:hypothetical protein
MRNVHTLTVALLLLLFAGTAFPQSLGDLARKEEERRKTIKTPSKIYTNGDLQGDHGGSVPVPMPPAPAPGSAVATPAPGGSAAAPPPEVPDAGTAPPPQAANAGTAAAPSQAQSRDQTYWKKRITDARSQVEQSKTLRDALQSRVNALNADFVNMDDPAQRSVIERDRQRALSELARLTKEIDEATKGIAAIEEEARRANVPPGWLR